MGIGSPSALGQEDTKRQMDKKSYIKQIEQYYNRNISSHELIELGMTPDILLKYGAAKLPLVMQQSTLTKCIRKQTGSRSAHNLPRSIIESLPEQIENPIYLIQDKERDSIAIISDAIDKDNNKILIAIKLKETRKEIQVNEIKSVYGKTNLREYLIKNADKNQVNIINKKKAEKLSRVLGLQLPTTLIASSYNKNVSLKEDKVNDQNSIYVKLQQNKEKIRNQSNSFSQKQKETYRDYNR